jgi:hypothetical protein
MTQAYAKYTLFKSGGCKNSRLLDEAISIYKDVRRLAKTPTTSDIPAVIRAEIGLTECHRELSHRYRYLLPQKLEHIDTAAQFIGHALMLAEQVGDKDLIWRARLEGAVIRARRAILISKPAAPGDVEVKAAVTAAKEEMTRLKDTPEVAGYKDFEKWLDLWLDRLPKTI